MSRHQRDVLTLTGEGRGPRICRDFVKQARALRLPEGAFQLVLSGHLEDGQIAIPYGFGKIRLARAMHDKRLNWRTALLHREGVTFDWQRPFEHEPVPHPVLLRWVSLGSKRAQRSENGFAQPCGPDREKPENPHE